MPSIADAVGRCWGGSCAAQGGLECSLPVWARAFNSARRGRRSLLDPLAWNFPSRHGALLFSRSDPHVTLLEAGSRMSFHPIESVLAVGRRARRQLQKSLHHPRTSRRLMA